MLSKNNRIGDRQVIDDLFRSGEVFKTKWFVFKYKKPTDSIKKFAVTVGKKISRKASERNRYRRQVYEAIRLELPSFDCGLLAFVIVRPSLVQSKPDFADIRKEVQRFLSKVIL